jgi:hypothetical protein
MENIFDYIDKNKETTFSDKPFNVLDALVFSGVSYFPFCLETKGCVIGHSTLKEVIYDFLHDKDLINRSVLKKLDPKLAKKVMKSKRYKDLKIFKYEDIYNEEKEEQFAALTFLIDDDTLFIAFRGTDITLIGWKEDLNMAFTFTTPGQESARKYVEQIAYRFPHHKIILGGHSKGGNFAIYAGAFSARNVQDRIIKIYNFDGPGFLEETIKKEGYIRIAPKVVSIVPSYSIVGMMLEHSSEYITVASKGIIALEQHIFYNWKIKGDSFVEAKRLSILSRNSHYALKGLFDKMSLEEREKFVSIIARLTLSTKMKTTRQVLEHVGECSKDIFDEYKKLTAAEKKLLRRTFIVLGLEFFKGGKRRIK